jgi:hypothetical protein
MTSFMMLMRTINGTLKEDPPGTPIENMGNDQYYIYCGGIDLIELFSGRDDEGSQAPTYKDENRLLQIAEYIKRTSYPFPDFLSLLVLRRNLEKALDEVHTATKKKGSKQRTRFIDIRKKILSGAITEAQGARKARAI